MKSILKAPFLLLGIVALFFFTGCFSSGDNLLEVFQHARGNMFAAVHLIICGIFIYEILNSNRSTVDKVLWTLILFFLPVIGTLMYYFMGRKS